LSSLCLYFLPTFCTSESNGRCFLLTSRIDYILYPAICTCLYFLPILCTSESNGRCLLHILPISRLFPIHRFVSFCTLDWLTANFSELFISQTLRPSALTNTCSRCRTSDEQKAFVMCIVCLSCFRKPNTNQTKPNQNALSVTCGQDVWGSVTPTEHVCETSHDV
jgi:hypothetical protein